MQPLLPWKKEITITYSECVFVALGIQRAMRMSRIILSLVTFPVLQYFSTLSHKRHYFRNKKEIIEYKMCFDFLYNFCLRHFSL